MFRASLLIGAAIGIFAGSSHAASLCTASSALSCDPNGIDLPGIHEVGFSTTGAPCQQGNNPSHEIRTSSSNTDPLVNQGAITGGYLYLWVYSPSSGPQYGFGGALTQFSGDLVIQAFDFISPGHGDYDQGTLAWGVDCVNTGWVLAGRLTVQEPTAVEASNWGRTKALYR
jgi:hypothetical protein